MPGPQKGTPKLTYYVDPWSRHYCFTCPLPDCQGENHVACPIHQAKARQRMAARLGTARRRPAPALTPEVTT